MISIFRDPCSKCLYYNKANGTCQSKKCATGGYGRVTILERLFCEPYTKKEFSEEEAE